MTEIIFKNLSAHTIVIHPPLIENKPLTISKLFANDVLLNHERQISHHIRENIKTAQEFAIQPIGYYYHDINYVKERLNISEADYIEFISGKMDIELDNKIVEVIYPNGGISLDKYMPCFKVHTDFFISAWRSLFYGLDQMYGKVCHNDIKPGNIVYELNTNVMRFIDFGTAMILKNNLNYRDTIYNAIGNFTSPPFYEYWAPEISLLMNYKVNQMNFKSVEDIANFYTQSNSNYNKIANYVLNQPELIEKARLDFTDLANFIHNSKNNPYRNNDGVFMSNIYSKSFCLQFIKNIDIYSLGISMGLMLYRLKMKGILKICYKHPICDLIAKMIVVDYRNRITPKDALKEFNKIFE